MRVGLAVVLALATATALKVATFVWCFFPAMTGAYPVLGVSLVQWCDCMTYREEMDTMEEAVVDGRAKFLQKEHERNSRSDPRNSRGGARSMH